MFDNRVRPRAHERLVAIVIPNREHRLLVGSITDLYDLRTVFRLPDRPSVDVQSVPNVNLHHRLLTISVSPRNHRSNRSRRELIWARADDATLQIQPGQAPGGVMVWRPLRLWGFQ
jgi:hypothetical protein